MKKRIKHILTLTLIVVLLIAAGSAWLYKTRYEIQPILTAASPSGEYSLTLCGVGEPDFPFGRVRSRLILSGSSGEICRLEIDLADDGCRISKDNFRITWNSDRVWVRIKASEQPDELWKICFDGRAELTYPAEHDIEKPAPLEFSVQENAAGEHFFKMEIEEFIRCFNKFYLQDHKGSYLHTLSTWDRLIINDKDIGHELIFRRFTADKEKYTQPETQLYMPMDEGGIYKLSLCFDQHGYRQDAFDEYREICYCALSCFLPQAERAQIYGLFDALYNNAVMAYPTQQKAQTLYCFGDVGFYTYFGGGTINIGIIPLTESVKENFSDRSFEIIQGDK